MLGHDKKLEDGISVEEVVVPHQKPSRFFDIPTDVINVVNIYLKPVILRNAKQKNVDVEKIIKNTKKMFSEGIRYNDDLWMQHTASSIRELICLLSLEVAFNNTYKSIPEYKFDKYIMEVIDKLNYIKSYFSDIVHFVEKPRLGLVSKIYPNKGYGIMRKEDFFRDEEEIFEQVCIDFIYIINDLFEDYVIGDK